MAPPAGTSRLGYLDTTKGLLVVLMVIYHSLNYSSQYFLAFRYICFLPPSFILITGLLVAAVYRTRYAQEGETVRKRLLVRGAKLLILFLILNVSVRMLYGISNGSPVDSVFDYFSHWKDVFLVGSGRSAIFEVLLPIAYFLILAPFFLAIDRPHPLILPGIAAVTVAGCWIVNRAGLSSANLNLLSAGVLGMACGSAITRHAHHLARPLGLVLCLAAYAVYLPIGMKHGYVYIVQIVGSLLAVVGLISISQHLGESSWLVRRIMRLGQYSLLAYIFQIALLQILLRLGGRPIPGSPEFYLFFAITLLGTTGFVELTHWLRNKSKLMGNLYQLAFA